MANNNISGLNQRICDLNSSCSRLRILFVAALFVIPVLFLTLAYLRMAIYYNKLWLLDTVVHENGRYTLYEVIFYFRHFSWEMLIKTLYSVFVVGAFLWYGNPASRSLNSPEKKVRWSYILPGLLVTAILASVTIIFNIREYGLTETLHGLLQYRTSETRSILFGSHWRNHFLSDIVLFSSSAAVILLFRHICCGGMKIDKRFGFFLPISLLLFSGLTVIFGFSFDPFKTPSYLGHQLREIVGTDLSITMMIAIGILIFLEGLFDFKPEKVDLPDKRRLFLELHPMYIWVLPAVLPVIYLVWKVMHLNISGEISALGKTSGWTIMDLFAWHFFEHSLDYVYVASLVSSLYIGMLVVKFRKADS